MGDKKVEPNVSSGEARVEDTVVDTESVNNTVEGDNEANNMVEDSVGGADSGESVGGAVEADGETVSGVAGGETVSDTVGDAEGAGDDVSNDSLVENHISGSVVDQGDEMVSWHITGLYDKSGVRSRLDILRKPPVLEIEGSDGSRVEFVLTKEFTNQLTSGLYDVKRVYYGAAKVRPDELSVDDRSDFVKVVDWCKQNPVKLGVGVVLVLFILFPYFGMMF